MFWNCRPATLTPSPARRWLSQRRFRWPLEVATASEALLDHVRRSTYSSLLPPAPTSHNEKADSRRSVCLDQHHIEGKRTNFGRVPSPT